METHEDVLGLVAASNEECLLVGRVLAPTHREPPRFLVALDAFRGLPETAALNFVEGPRGFARALPDESVASEVGLGEGVPPDTPSVSTGSRSMLAPLWRHW